MPDSNFTNLAELHNFVCKQMYVGDTLILRYIGNNGFFCPQGHHNKVAQIEYKKNPDALTGGRLIHVLLATQDVFCSVCGVSYNLLVIPCDDDGLITDLFAQSARAISRVSVTS